MTGPYNKKSQGPLRRLSFFKILIVYIYLFQMDLFHSKFMIRAMTLILTY